MLKDFNELSGIQIDALKEIGNIGSGNAATALAQMIQTKIDMNVPVVSILPFDQVVGLVGGADLPVAGLYFRVSGSIQASICFMIPLDQASGLIDMLLGREPGEQDMWNLGELELSALKEAGNIVSATYLNALAHFTKLQLYTSVPDLAMDMVGAILSSILAQFGDIADTVLVLETRFKKGQQDVVGHFFLFPGPDSLTTILSALGVNC